jgi:murein DD-endopeptidase MepM/ murein hydrolase activator NlpD
MARDVFEKLAEQAEAAVQKDQEVHFDYADPKQNKDARSYVYELRRQKSEVEKTRKEKTASLLERKRAIDARAKAVMEPLQGVIDRHATEITRVEEAEKARQEALEEELEQLRLMGTATGEDGRLLPSGELERRIALLEGQNITADRFGEAVEEAENLQTMGLAVLRQEIEVARTQEAEREELDRLRREAAEREAEERRRQAQRAAEEEQRERERKEQEARIAQLEREAKEQRQRAERAAQAERERIEQEAAAKAAREEQERQEAAAKAEAEEKARKDAEERRAAVTARYKAAKDTTLMQLEHAIDDASDMDPADLAEHLFNLIDGGETFSHLHFAAE